MLLTSLESSHGQIAGHFKFTQQLGQVSTQTEVGTCEPCVGIKILLRVNNKVTDSDRKIIENKRIDLFQNEDMESSKRASCRNYGNPDNSQLEDKTNVASNMEEYFKNKNESWERWRNEQELNWREKLRMKEAATIRVLEEKAEENEKEHLKALSAVQLEYSRLEQRLKKSIAN